MPDELAALAGEDGLRWSTGTNNRIRDPLRIVEISLTHQAATNGLPPVSWHRAGVSKGNLPVWVAAELERAASIAHAAHCSFTSSGPRSDSAPKGAASTTGSSVPRSRSDPAAGSSRSTAARSDEAPRPKTPARPAQPYGPRGWLVEG